MPKQKVNFYIDGFNVYHQINSYKNKSSNHKCYKWLNYRSLFESIIDKNNEEIGKIFFFTAIPKGFFPKDKIERHNIYIKALESVDIEIREGVFKPDEKILQLKYTGYYLKIGFPVEKQTDINIAAHMLRHAYTLDKSMLSKLFLMSGDTDFVPVLKDIKRFTDKEIGILTRPYDNIVISRDKTTELENQCSIDSNGNHLIKEITFKNLDNHCFTSSLTCKDGSRISIPREYQLF